VTGGLSVTGDLSENLRRARDMRMSKFRFLRCSAQTYGGMGVVAR
jgi:hypothetical protein